MDTPEIPQVVNDESETLTRAKRGVAEFGTLLSNVPDNVAESLIWGISGSSFQSMFLGLRPVYYPGPDLEEHVEYGAVTVDEVAQYLAPGILYSKDAYGFYSPELVKQKALDYPEYFNGTLDPAEILKVAESDDTQTGLLIGFPLKAVLSWAKYSAEWRAFVELMQQKNSPEEWRFLYEYTAGEDMNNFREAHRSEAAALLDKYFPDFSPEAKTYILNRRHVDVRGFIYGADDPEDINEFPQAVKDLFRESGMNKLVVDYKRSHLLQEMDTQ